MSNQNILDSILSPPSQDNEKIVLDLLNEYSAKLREMIEIRQSHVQWFIFILAIVTTLFLFSITFLLVSLSNSDFIYWSYSILIFAAIIAISLIYYSIRTRRYLKWTKQEILIAKNELERVIRTVSQLEDHSDFYGYGLELKARLRLTESEGVIRFVDEVLGTQYAHPYSKPSDQARPQAPYSDLPASSNVS